MYVRCPVCLRRLQMSSATFLMSRKWIVLHRESSLCKHGREIHVCSWLDVGETSVGLVKGARWLTRGINLEESCKQMCFYRAQWKRLWQSPLESGKAALGGPGPWRSRMSPRKATKRRNVPAAPASWRKKARPTSASFSLSHWLLLTAMLLFFCAIPVVNTQTTLFSGENSFWKEVFP